jgi:hypothetical protein
VLKYAIVEFLLALSEFGILKELGIEIIQESSFFIYLMLVVNSFSFLGDLISVF